MSTIGIKYLDPDHLPIKTKMKKGNGFDLGDYFL